MVCLCAIKKPSPCWWNGSRTWPHLLTKGWQDSQSVKVITNYEEDIARDKREINSKKSISKTIVIGIYSKEETGVISSTGNTAITSSVNNFRNVEV